MVPSFLAKHIHPSIHPSIYPSIRTYIHTFIHPSIHAYMHTFIHPSIHPSIHSYIHTCIHAYMHTCIHPSIHPSIHPYIHTYIYRLFSHVTPRSTRVSLKNEVSDPCNVLTCLSRGDWALLGSKDPGCRMCPRPKLASALISYDGVCRCVTN